MIALYNAANGPGWKNSENWLSDAPLDQRHGVVADCDGSVIGLNLDDNQLSGPIPPELGKLALLKTLFLDDNQLSGQIPPQLGKLAILTTLFLEESQLSGPIPPELGKLENLRELYLSGNQLTGCVAQSLTAVESKDIYRLGLKVCEDS